MSAALAVEWARFGINVNAIAPGAFASEMMDSTQLCLVAPASEFVTGTTVRIDDAQGGR